MERGKNVKTRATYYTEEKIRHARNNIDKYGWAAKLKTAAVQAAEPYVALGWDEIWKLVPPQSLPRSYGVNQKMGSPVTKKEIDQFGNYPYQAEPLSEPWKIVDPSSGYKFPTNDFGAYYESGLDEHGIFQHHLADRDLLVNTLYPEKGPTWGVDDGLGWVDEHGHHYTFIAYYTHWFLWYGAEGIIPKALNALRDAYLYTGEDRYACAGIVLLDRVADIYPDLDTSVVPPHIFLSSSGGTSQGKAVGSIWETGLVKNFVKAYDAFFPAMDHPDVITFLNQKAVQYGLPAKKSAADIRFNIEEGIVRQVYKGIKAAQIRGNMGMHQSALAMAAVVLDTMPDTQEWIEFNNQAGGLLRDPYRVTGGNQFAILVNEVDRDGHGLEAAPGYNHIWMNQFLDIADILYGYDKVQTANFFENVKFYNMLTSFIPLLLSEEYVPPIGDSAKTGNPNRSGLYLTEMVKIWAKTNIPLVGQMIYLLNGNSTEGLHGDIFDVNAGRLDEEIAAVIHQHGPLALPSTHLTGYGFTALRAGDSSSAIASSPQGTLRNLWIYYGRNVIYHGHADTLNLGVHAYGLDLTPDLGYPEYADPTDMHRAQWVRNTISHNTVVVDQKMQSLQLISLPHHFDDTGHVALIDVEAPLVYPQTSLYRRTAVMIQIDEEHSYYVDLFNVHGGSDHHFSFHGAEGSVETDGLRLQLQTQGTYASPDIEWGSQQVSAEVKGSGFQWLRGVERDVAPAEQFAIEWNVKDTWDVYGQGAHAPTDVRLRLTMLGEYDEVALADGVPPRNKSGNPQELRYVLVRRSGENLRSLFTSVIEPYQGQRQIQKIEKVTIQRLSDQVALEQDSGATALKVTMANGRTDYIIYSLDPQERYIVDQRLVFSGFVGVYSERDGQMDCAYLNDGTQLGLQERARSLSEQQQSFGRLTGKVVDFTRELSMDNTITVRMDLRGENVERLIDQYIYIDNGYKDHTPMEARNAVYLIHDVSKVDNDVYALSIGQTTVIRKYVNTENYDEGFVYDIAPGQSFYVPLTTTVQSK